jgi:hypothetical protein
VNMLLLCISHCEYKCEEKPVSVFVDLLRLESIMVKPDMVLTGDIP